jgi:hypothetical protein
MGGGRKERATFCIRRKEGGKDKEGKQFIPPSPFSERRKFMGKM